MTVAMPPPAQRSMEIRPATEDDVLPLARLFTESVTALGPDAYSPDQVTAWTATTEATDSFRDFILRPRTYVACDASGPLGFAGLEPDGHVASVYVREDRLREGIGSRLLSHVITEATNLGIVRLFAEASEFSRPLFLKYGFRSIGTETVERNGVTFVRHLVERRL